MEGRHEMESKPSDVLPSLHSSTKRDLLWVPGDSPVFRAGQPMGELVPSASWDFSRTLEATKTPLNRLSGNTPPHPTHPTETPRGLPRQ